MHANKSDYCVVAKQGIDVVAKQGIDYINSGYKVNIIISAIY